MVRMSDISPGSQTGLCDDEGRRSSARPQGGGMTRRRSPLREAGLSKAEVRALALFLGIPN